MDVEDVLVGDKSVVVETSGETYRLQRTNETQLREPDEELPEAVVDELRDYGFRIGSFPTTLTHYLHDEATPHTRERIADKVGLPEDSGVVQRIANIGYEVAITVRVEDATTAYVTQFNGEELAEPIEL